MEKMENKKLVGEKEFREFDEWLYNKVMDEVKRFNPDNEKKRAMVFMFGIKERIGKVLDRNPPEEVFGSVDKKIRDKKIRLLQKTILSEINLLKKRIKFDVQKDEIGGAIPNYIGYIG